MNDKDKVKALIAGALLGVAALMYVPPTKADQSSLFSNSPRNYENSGNNYDNSSNNWNNSPNNWENSRSNLDSTNSTYDTNGRRTGYEVRAPSGVINRYDNEGNRTGYRR